jgi:hypothetical protein
MQPSQLILMVDSVGTLYLILGHKLLRPSATLKI